VYPEDSGVRPSTDPIRDSPALSGEAIFLAQLALIDRVIAFVCRRNHLNATDAEDFASHARLRLMDDDYAVLRKFQGRSSLKTFLTITLQRMFYDYRIAAWGKWRPSAEAPRRTPSRKPSRSSR
jgi:DNA-directed RNA polymerase specialized sigma24 family protein